ncbi:MAG: RNA polymerase sigma factor [Bacteroidales bacterium]|nr:RNA polymerase sigma factor [Bacteroidales bacterium]
MPDQEQSILEAALRGGREGRERFYRCYSQRLMYVIGLYLRDREEAEDALQEAFVRIFDSLPRFRRHGNGSLFAWMRSIAVHAACDHLRNADAFRKVDLDELQPELYPVEDPPDKAPPSPPMDELRQMIARLPLHQQTVFKLRYFENKRHEEIARELHIKEKTSSSLLWHAREKLRKMIQKYWEEQQ